MRFIFLCSSYASQELLICSRNLEFFTNGYRYLIQILPVAVVAPMYFSGKIEFGVINQSISAFNHILGDFSLVVYQFQAISAFSAVIDRLGMILSLKIVVCILLARNLGYLLEKFYPIYGFFKCINSTLSVSLRF